MRTLFQRMFLPAMEPTNDPAVQIEATLAARERLRRYELEREERMARVRMRADKSSVGSHRAPVLQWRAVK